MPGLRPSAWPHALGLAITLFSCVALLGAGQARSDTPAPPERCVVGTPEDPCWVEVSPYPFGVEGTPVDDGAPDTDRLTVGSLAFRAWNRGLALMSEPTTPFGVWLFNGTRWYPDPTFPGKQTCRGTRVTWAGKRDYWVFGGASLCRFDGFNYEWQPLQLPAETVARDILLTEGACRAWNDCLFVGTRGGSVHWDGTALRDVPQAASNALRDALFRRTADGRVLSAVVAGTSATVGFGPPVETDPNAVLPQLFSVVGNLIQARTLPVPTNSLPGDPFRTDLAFVDLDDQGNGWTAGNPAGTNPVWTDSGASAGAVRGRAPGDSTTDFSPLVPIGPNGPVTDCAGPPADMFTYSALGDVTDDVLWTGLSMIPLAPRRAAWAGALFHEAQAPAQEAALIHFECGRPPVVYRFQAPDPSWEPPDPCPRPCEPPLIQASHDGFVTAVAANAPNDAWASTTQGIIITSFGRFTQPARLYRWSDGLPPAAPPGDDVEEPRPLPRADDPPEYILEPPPPPPPPPVLTTTRRLGPAIDRIRIKAKRKVKLVRRRVSYRGRTVMANVRTVETTLYITFRVRRPARVQVLGLRRSRVVARTKSRRFKAGRRGRLVMRPDPKRWPKRFKFNVKSPPNSSRN